MIRLPVRKNSDYSFLINITPSSGTETFMPLAAGIRSVKAELNEKVHNAAYLSDDGWGSSDVTGAQLAVTFSGDRVCPDPAQDYIFSHDVMYGLGSARRTTFKILDPAGNTLSGSCTLAEIVCDGGKADEPGEITVKLRFNGKPVYTPA